MFYLVHQIYFTIAKPREMGSSIATLSQSTLNIEYEISFNNDLQDGEYSIVITDDAGNQVVGSNDQNLLLKPKFQKFLQLY